LPQASKDLPVVVSKFGEEAAAEGMALVAGEGLFKARCREMQENESHPENASSIEASASSNAG
jgi:hypothetical protein